MIGLTTLPPPKKKSPFDPEILHRVAVQMKQLERYPQGWRDVFIMLYVHPPSKRGYRH